MASIRELKDAESKGIKTNREFKKALEDKKKGLKND